MKTLDFEKMEQIEGGFSYCGQLSYWLRNPMDFQGDIYYLHDIYEHNCR
ncbi:MAG: hypothetical protein HOO91_13820 [Bacteroidales bacterium]|nr:hypothetical protein [Bacteroidales bacterium]